MAIVATDNLEYLVTRFHVRRSQMLEAERLEALCRLRTVAELGEMLYPGSALLTHEKLQRRLVQDLVQELVRFRRHAGDSGHEFMDWQLARFQMENIKILLRGLLNQLPMAGIKPHLVNLPVDQTLNVQRLTEAGSVQGFAALLPAGKPRDWLEDLLSRMPEVSEAFLLEMALDCGYHQELLKRAARLPDDEKEIINALVFQEVNLFQLMLVVRGKFHQNLPPTVLLPFHVPGSGVSDSWFKNLLAATDISTAIKCSRGIALDQSPRNLASADPPTTIKASDIEAGAWRRLWRLANSAFRRSHMGLGAIIGYHVLRRLEVANLITLSEGIRLGVEPGLIQGRLILCGGLEAAHV